MIKFFRKIRHNLLSEGKTGTYIKYATGEVILITIGILIAVQINSFQTYQNNRQIEKKVLKELKNDLKKDITDLNNLLNIKKDQLAKCNYVLNIFNNPNKNISDSTKFMDNIRKPFYFYVDNPHKTTFELSKSSGDLFKITNEALINMITIYFSDNDASQFLETTKKFSTEYMSDVYMKYHKLNFHDFEKFKINFLMDFKMENYYVLMTENLDVGIDVISKKRMNAIKLMEHIDKEFLRHEN